MSQRDSGYQRIENDAYETPEWVTKALLPHLRPGVETVWEPACGGGKMVEILQEEIAHVLATDIMFDGDDFLKRTEIKSEGIVTNPPYILATEFIDHALNLMKPNMGFVAMLLRTDFDHAIRRKYLFGKNPQFSKKLVLTKRISWFKDAKGSPSFNHAWFIWDWRHSGPPTLAYGPEK